MQKELVPTIPTKDKTTAKKIIEKLREISEKQRISTERIIKQKTTKLIQEKEKELLKEEKEKSCLICSDAVLTIMNHSQKIIEDAEAIKEMHKTKTDKIKMKDGLTYTIDDINARIERNKCTIQKNWDRYIQCCKEGKLQEEERC